MTTTRPPSLRIVRVSTLGERRSCVIDSLDRPGWEWRGPLDALSAQADLTAKVQELGGRSSEEAAEVVKALVVKMRSNAAGPALAVVGASASPAANGNGERADGETRAQADKPSSDRTLPSQATALVQLVNAAGVTLFHSPGGEGYACVPIVGHREVWPLNSREFQRGFLGRLFYEAKGKAPGGQALADAVSVLAGQARFDGPETPVHVRTAGHEGEIFLDLADADWNVVRINSYDWQIIHADNAPVRFRRARGMLPLPTPVRGGKIGEMRRFLNLGSDSDWTLAVEWEVASLRPDGPYPILALHGEQGSAKSTTARVLRAGVDPNKAPLRAAPKEERDLAIAASNSLILAFDNLSTIPHWLSDAMCRISSGAGFATRSLYTDADESIFDGARPILLNSIEEVARRPDLLDRSIILYLPTIDESKRLPEAKFFAAFNEARPRILGALLDAVSGALRNLPNVSLSKTPRMADFAMWADAAEAPLGLEKGAFMSAYDLNRQGAQELTLEASPVAQAVCVLARAGTWAGTATALLAQLTQDLPHDDRGNAKLPFGWPKDGTRLSGRLRRDAPVLRSMGVGVTFERDGARTITITSQSLGKVGKTASTASLPPVVDTPGGPQRDAVMTLPDASRSQLASLSSLDTANRHRDADDAKSRYFSKEAPDHEEEEFRP